MQKKKEDTQKLSVQLHIGCWKNFFWHKKAAFQEVMIKLVKVFIYEIWLFKKIGLKLRQIFIYLFIETDLVSLLGTAKSHHLLFLLCFSLINLMVEFIFGFHSEFHLAFLLCRFRFCFGFQKLHHSNWKPCTQPLHRWWFDVSEYP